VNVTNEALVPDGIYFFLPEGGGWYAAKVQKGRLVDTTDDSLADSHAAGDSWAGIVPSKRDDICNEQTATEVMLAVMRCGLLDPALGDVFTVRRMRSD